MKVHDIRDLLKTVIEHVYHYEAPAKIPDKYAVWGETGVSMRMNSDNGTEYAAVSGEIIYYTKTEYDKNADQIVNVFEKSGIVCTLESIGYDYELCQIVYTYKFEVSCGKGNLYA